MTSSLNTITLPFDNRTQTYDRDKLATALLVRMDVIDDDPAAGSLLATRNTALALRNEHGFATDAITYAIGARICHENNIDPYRGVQAVSVR